MRNPSAVNVCGSADVTWFFNVTLTSKVTSLYADTGTYTFFPMSFSHEFSHEFYVFLENLMHLILLSNRGYTAKSSAEEKDR